METTSTRNSSSSSSRFARATCIAVVCLMLLGHFAAGPSLQQRVKRALFGAGESGGMYLVHPKYVRANADGTGEVSIGSGIGWLQDLSGNGLHLTQATAPARPMLQQDAGGHWYAALDGVDDELRSTFSFDVEIGNFLAVALFDRDIGGVGRAGFGTSLDFNNRHVLVTAAARAQLRYGGGVYDKSTTAPAAQPSVVTSLISEGALDVSINGAAPEQTTNPAITAVSIDNALITTSTSVLAAYDFYGGIAHAGDPGEHRALVVRWLKQISGVA